MPNAFFKFKQFTIHQDRCAMKVTTDGCLFGAWAAEQISDIQPAPVSLLDIGSGTGLLSLMIAQKNQMQMEGVEIDAEAYLQGIENILSSPWNSIKLFHGDIKNLHTETRYDCIITNPPFYEKELNSCSPARNMAHHGNGLRIDALLQVIKNIIDRKGSFFLMFPYKRMNELETKLSDSGFFVQKKVVVKPSLSHAPFRVMIHASLIKSTVGNKEQLIIWDEKKGYTEDFIKLMKDYYLYL